MPNRPLIPFVESLSFLLTGLIVGMVIGIHSYYVNPIMVCAIVLVIACAILRFTLKQ